MKHARTDYDARIQDSAGLIPDDEPVLLIRGQDQMAVTTIEFWIRGATQIGVAPELLEAMERHRLRIMEWQGDHGNKVPDAPAEALQVSLEPVTPRTNLLRGLTLTAMEAAVTHCARMATRTTRRTPIYDPAAVVVSPVTVCGPAGG